MFNSPTIILFGEASLSLPLKNELSLLIHPISACEYPTIVSTSLFSALTPHSWKLSSQFACSGTPIMLLIDDSEALLVGL